MSQTIDPTLPTGVGSPFYFATSGKSEVGNPAQLQELKTLLNTVERAKYVWESTFDAIVHPVMIINRQYQIERANWAAAQASGQNVKEWVGKRCYEVFAKRESPCSRCPLKQEGHFEKSAVSRLEPFGDEREYEAVSFPLKGREQDLDFSIVQYRDIRDERRFQQRLVQSEKMAALGLLAGGVAHEINNPLSGILAFSQLSLQQVEPGSQLAQDIKEIELSALRCKKIVENLLEFASPSHFEAHSPIDLTAVFEKVHPLLKVLLKEAGVQLQTEFASSLPLVLGNINQLEQVFLNLTSNACHASQKGSKIHLKMTIDHDPHWVRIDFSDQGSGIPTEKLDKIFDPFFTTKKPGVGTGLGLSILYQIIQDHGGWVEVASQVGQGSQFQIFLPVFEKGGSAL